MPGKSERLCLEDYVPLNTMSLQISTTDVLLLRCMVYTYPGRLSLRGLLATADYLDHSVLTYAEISRSLQVCLGAGWVTWENVQLAPAGALDRLIREASVKKLSERKRLEWIVKRIEKEATAITIILPAITLTEEEYNRALEEYRQAYNR